MSQSLNIAPDAHGRSLWAVAAERYSPVAHTWVPMGVTHVHARDAQGAHLEFRRMHAGQIIRIVAVGPPVGFFTKDGRVFKA